MKTLQIATTIALSISLFGFAYAGGRGGGGGGGGGGSSRGGGGGGGGGGSSFRVGGMGGGGAKGPSKGQSFLPKIGGLGGNGGPSSGGKSGSNSNGNGKGSKGKLYIGVHFGTQRCYHAPVVVVPGPNVLFAPEPVAPEEIASGGTVELPGDWGGEAGYACLMQGEKYTYFKVLEWSAKGVKLGVPRLDIKEPIEAELLMVRSDRYAYPRIPVIVYPPLAQTAGAVANGAKTAGVAADGQAAAAKTEQSATPAASDVPAELDGEGTFEQLEKEAAGDKTK